MTKKKSFLVCCVALIVSASTSSCNLPAGGTPPLPMVQGGPVSSPPAASGFSVQITHPASGDQLSKNDPVRVGFHAVGGPFIEFDLFADDVLVDSQSVSLPEPAVRSELQWKTPSEGAHTLRIQAVDMNKDTASAEVSIQIGAGSLGAETAPADAFQVGFLNISDGGSLPAVIGPDGKPVVAIQVRVSGPPSSMISISMTANGVIATAEVQYSGSALPYTTEIRWSPLGGGGSYILKVSAVNDQKQTVQATVHVTVTGVAAFTPTPPPLGEAAARERFRQLFMQLYGVNIPYPSMQRFDFPELPNRSRWIGDFYYQGKREYIELFDDTHYELSGANYAGSAVRGSEPGFTLCRPEGNYKILVVFVDYGNLAIDRPDALAQVPIFAEWTNRLYDDFARSQGFASSPLHLEAQSAWISPPPSPGNLLTAGQIRSSTALDPADFDLVMEIDLDQDNSVGKSHWKGVLDQGGGIALQGCGAYYDGDVNIWSIVMASEETQQQVEGALSMDFNHELSHIFGMMDNWPFRASAVTSPDGMRHDDWIPYVLFGWTDTDGDGIPEIIDPTPYGTAGPRP